MDIFAQDVRYAMRVLCKSPQFTLTVVMTLALGIGANTAIFSVVHAVLLRQLPFKNPDRIVNFENANRVGLTPQSRATFYEAAQSFRSVGSVAMYYVGGVNFTAGNEAQRVTTAEVGAHFFDALNVKPLLGRLFFSHEDAPGNDSLQPHHTAPKRLDL